MKETFPKHHIEWKKFHSVAVSILFLFSVTAFSALQYHRKNFTKYGKYMEYQESCDFSYVICFVVKKEQN